jgi:surfeit locus 1 family protein
MSAGITGRVNNFRFDWKLSLLTALLMPLLLSLGFWQLRRAAEKEALQHVYETRQQEAAVPLASLDPAADLQYRQVKFSGHYDNSHVFLLDNRIYQGKPGYEVIVPLLTDENTLVLVNRGWIAPGSSRQSLPTVAAVDGAVAVQGSVYQNIGKQVVLGADIETAGWPKVVQTLDPLRMAELAGTTDASRVFPHSVRVDENASGALVRYWPVMSTSPERHFGYAVQWFAMALALAGLYFFYSTKPEILSDSEH